MYELKYMSDKPKPDDRSDNVERIQKISTEPSEISSLPEELIEKTDDEK